MQHKDTVLTELAGSLTASAILLQALLSKSDETNKKKVYLFESSSCRETGGLSLSLCGENCGDGERCPSIVASLEGLWEEAGGEEAGWGLDVDR